MSRMRVWAPRLGAFVADMVRKLSVRKNAGKPDWRMLSLDELREEIAGEYFELRRALMELESAERSRSEEAVNAAAYAVLMECADVGNRAMMVHDRIRAMYRPQRPRP